MSHDHNWETLYLIPPGQFKVDENSRQLRDQPLDAGTVFFCSGCGERKFVEASDDDS